MAQPLIPTTAFYSPETPPKKSRLQDCNVKPPFQTFKEHLVNFDRKLAAEPARRSIDNVTSTHDSVHQSSRKVPTCLGRDSPLPLKNLGNTCYENSIIQCLFSLDIFMENLNRSIETISDKTDEQADFRYRILTAFHKLHESYEDSFPTNEQEEQRSSQQHRLESRLEELKLAVGERSSQFNSAHQQDASEFFYHVIDSIQEYYQSLKTEDHDNPVTQTFELELDYMMRCPKCHHKIISESEKIRTLPLALPHVDNDVPRSNMREEDVNRIPTPPTSDLGLESPKSSTNLSDEPAVGSEEKENRSFDDVIEAYAIEIITRGAPDPPSDADSGLEGYSSKPSEPPLYTLSDALNNYFKDDILDLKCSQSTCDSTQRTKKCLIKKLPQVLFITLARYSYSGKKSLDEIEAPFELSVPFQENKSPCHSPSAHRDFGEHDNNYHLVAVVCHLGSSLDAGHYTSYVYNQSNSTWYSCDDDSITKVQESEVQSDAKKSGYCFFYAHKSCIKKPKKELVFGSSETRDRDFKQIRLDVDDSVTSCVESSAVMTPESSPSPPATSHQDTSLMESGDTDCGTNKNPSIVV